MSCHGLILYTTIFIHKRATKMQKLNFRYFANSTLIKLWCAVRKLHFKEFLKFLQNFTDYFFTDHFFFNYKPPQTAL